MAKNQEQSHDSSERYPMYLVAASGQRADLDKVEQFLAARGKTLDSASPADLQAAIRTLA